MTSENKPTTKIVNEMEFTLIRYLANGEFHETWYPTENLATLSCKWSIA